MLPGVVRRIAFVLCLVVPVSLGVRHVRAANGAKPRAAVLWSDAPCVQVVDRSQTPTLHFDYAVSQQELVDGEMRTSDEVDDSRTLQFFAFRSQRYEHVPPTWITQADIDRAAVKDPEVHPADVDPVEILAGGPVFTADEWLRITPDDARLPIDDAQAAMGLDWDLADVPAAPWLVWGYTWEPVRNRWSPRWSLVKVIDDAGSADAAGPAVLLLPNEQILTAGEPYTPKGCVDAPAGSTLTLEWGVVLGTAEPQWEPLVEDEPVDSGDLTLTVEFPEDAAMHNVHLRATIRDPKGRTYTAFTSKQLSIMPGAGGDDGGGDGCGCDLEPRTKAPWLAVVIAFGLRRRPRSRHARP